MPYTPVELRHVKLGRALLGFRRDETERLLADVADSFEDVWRERGELADRVEEQERRLEELRQREALLASTLVSAEKAATEAKEQAKREAELIVAEAHGEARSIMRAAQNERERLFGEARRVESLLRAALGMVVESRVAEPAAPAEPAAAQAAEPSGPAVLPPAAEERPAVPTLPPASPDEHWPKRSDTREFQVIKGHEGRDEGAGEPAGPEQAPPALPEPPAGEAREFAWGD
ncbi:MAG TPA: DivIVA domain-containing protein [Gaiellaceae bacterium]|jgi:cell division initiation protein